MTLTTWLPRAHRTHRAPAGPLDRRGRTRVLAICCLSLFLVGVDNTIVNLALPAIQRDLHVGVSGLQWVVAGYTVVLATLLLPAGAAGDRFGRRRTFQTGLVLFTLGSLLCSVAPGLGTLVAARMAQAVGGSMLNPVAMSIITNTFTEPRERARAIGVWGAVAGVSLALGPLLGGLLVDTVGWRGVFWATVPVGLAALALCARYVPESRAERARPLDPVGQLLIVVLLGSLTYGVIEAPTAGWTAPQTLLCGAAALLAAACFVPYELRNRAPVIDPRLLRSAPFAGAAAIAVCGFAALGGFLLLNTLYLQDVRDYSPLHAGLLTLPLAVLAMVCSPFSGRLVATRGPRLPLIAAGAAMAAGTATLTGLTAGTPDWQLVVAYSLFGIGFGMLNAPITTTAVSGMPRDRAGVAAAVASTSRQTGQLLGVTVLGSLATSAVRGPLHSGFAAASHVGWWVATGCALTVLALGILTTGRWAGRSAARVAQRLESVPTERAVDGGST
ncbi:MFS transporter [Streptomyces tateyamensis]|uniref:MFS transporter n=1 Tax=Streptomyces tateyamensis TaxID=565073 RepID=A0A2V4P146_9ACTN|nr:MFS transporter [Streptomyces tateyamensis]PYC88392.1 MFS transporter [Streptomyces tateyamensis]